MANLDAKFSPGQAIERTAEGYPPSQRAKSRHRRNASENAANAVPILVMQQWKRSRQLDEDEPGMHVRVWSRTAV
jgi:hypothetical protein